MTYYVTALQADRSKLFVKELKTSDRETADHVAALWTAQGFFVIRRSEL